MAEKNISDRLRTHRAERIPMNDLRPAAVLIPLIWLPQTDDRPEDVGSADIGKETEGGKNDGGEWNVLFEIRSGRIVQGGEICFPGGSIESGESGAEAAVRETAEELLIGASQVKLICPMHQVTGPGGREVTSYLGVLHDYQGTWEKDEVSRTFLLPLSWFAAHPAREYWCEMETKASADFPVAQISSNGAYPFQPVGKKFYFYYTPYGVLWGMTAQLMHAALPLLQA